MAEKCLFALGGCETGQAKITAGYDLPARHVIHAVGPVWAGGGRGEPELLASCYRRALELAEEHGVRTIAFPAIRISLEHYFEDRRKGAFGTHVLDVHRRAGQTYLMLALVDTVVFNGRTGQVAQAPQIQPGTFCLK